MRFKVKTVDKKTYLVDEDSTTPASFIKDEEALEENIDEDVTETNAVDAKNDDKEDESGELDLTKKEVKLLKKLLKGADDLLALIGDAKNNQEDDNKDSKKSDKVDEDKKAEDSDFDFDEDGVGLEEPVEEQPDEETEDVDTKDSDGEDNEEVVETEANDSCDVDDVKIQDSRKSFGSIEKRTSVVDSDCSIEDEIAEAWAKRYNGGK